MRVPYAWIPRHALHGIAAGYRGQREDVRNARFVSDACVPEVTRACVHIACTLVHICDINVCTYIYIYIYIYVYTVCAVSVGMTVDGVANDRPDAACYVCMYVYTYVYTYVYIYVYVYVCVYMYIYI